MTETNVERSLDAAESALQHFVASLEKAGFASSADAYSRLTDVLIAQWLWTEENGISELQSRFDKIADLAESISLYLQPYVEAMTRICAIRRPRTATSGTEPESLAGQILQALFAAGHSMTASQLRAATGASSTALRRELAGLANRKAIVKTQETRPRYLLFPKRIEPDPDGDVDYRE